MLILHRLYGDMEIYPFILQNKLIIELIMMQDFEVCNFVENYRPTFHNMICEIGDIFLSSCVSFML